LSVAFEELMGLTNRLLVHAQALAALTARLRLDQLGVEGDPAVRAQLDRVVEALDADEGIGTLTEQERSVLASLARSYLAQAVDLVEDPVRGGAWSHSDPVLLRAQGSASGAVASLIAGAGLGSDGARILDVGTGVAGLGIAFCETFPESTVVGLDPFEPALAIARDHVASAGLDSRITLLPTPIEDFDDPVGFDLIWLPSFFIPEAVLDRAIERIFAVTRPRGVVVVGMLYAGGDDVLAAAVDDLFTVRSGGSVVYPEDAVARLQRAGFTEVDEVERTSDAPLRFVVGRRS
jgi:2-polyprenyl-3-methyl-5-hydroxy-6-metoxy-1,4-benzoquinol methylase